MSEQLFQTATRDGMKSSALFSPNGGYRYTLRRQWAVGDPLVFIGLNPSTADAERDDATVARCMLRARRLGYPGLLMLNVFALRSTDPAVLKHAGDPVGPENDRWLREAAAYDTLFVAAWGTLCPPERAREVEAMFPPGRLWCLGRTKHGHPRHPLYVRSDKPLERFS